MTDPTPRTAATARERVDVDAVIRNWWNDGPRKTWRKDFADPDTRRDWLEELGRQMTRALAAAEDPGRVAALERLVLDIAADAVCHATSGGTEGVWCIDHDERIDAPGQQCRDVARWRALAAPASPAGVSREVCAVCKDVRLGVQHDRYSMSAWHPFRAAPAPTPSEPVGRLAVPVLCNLAGHPSRLHHHDRDGKVRMVPTPATRDE